MTGTNCAKSVKRTLIKQTIIGNQYMNINKLRKGIHEKDNKLNMSEDLKKINTKKTNTKD